MASNDRNATAGIDQHTATVVTTAVRVRRDMAMASTTEMIAAEYSVDTKRTSATIDTDNSVAGGSLWHSDCGAMRWTPFVAFGLLVLTSTGVPAGRGAQETHSQVLLSDPDTRCHCWKSPRTVTLPAVTPQTCRKC
jgi:hypothetical protein